MTVSGARAVEVIVTDERAGAGVREAVDLHRWQALALGVLDGEGVVGPAELHLAFVDAGEMTALNAEHMGVEAPTDVLSFPLDAAPDPVADGPGPRLLGDVVVCPAVAAREAGAGEGAAYEAEIALLVVHGILHILGMDHAEPDEAAAMVTRERLHLASIGVERRP